MSEKEGDFSFKNVLPGNYIVRAAHDQWQLKSSQVKVTVQSDSQTIDDGLVVLGYPVQGHVSSEGEPIQSVIFSLYSEREDDSSYCGLNAPSISIPNQETGAGKLICQTSSDLKGQFFFPVVQPGRYRLVPLYQGENIRFDITPAAVEFNVDDGNVIMAQKFEVNSLLFHQTSRT